MPKLIRKRSTSIQRGSSIASLTRLRKRMITQLK